MLHTSDVVLRAPSSVPSAPRPPPRAVFRVPSPASSCRGARPGFLVPHEGAVVSPTRCALFSTSLSAQSFAPQGPSARIIHEPRVPGRASLPCLPSRRHFSVPLLSSSVLLGFQNKRVSCPSFLRAAGRRRRMALCFRCNSGKEKKNKETKRTRPEKGGREGGPR